MEMERTYEGSCFCGAVQIAGPAVIIYWLGSHKNAAATGCVTGKVPGAAARPTPGAAGRPTPA